MNPRVRVFLLAFCILLPLPALGQTAEDEAENRRRQLERMQRLENERRLEETRRLFDRMTEQQSASPPSTFRGSSRGSAERGKFFETVPLFREATAQFREAVGLQPDLKPYLKNVEKLIDPLEDYFESQGLKQEIPKPTELQDLTGEQLSWETLTATERVDNNLQLAVKLVRQAERDGAIDIRVLEFYGAIHQDLATLRWLIDKSAEVGRGKAAK